MGHESQPEHREMVQRLTHLNFSSVYHAMLKEEHGRESQPTFHQNRKPDCGYHIDYIFVPESLLGRVRSLSVGWKRFWLQHSDHSPVLITMA